MCAAAFGRGLWLLRRSLGSRCAGQRGRRAIIEDRFRRFFAREIAQCETGNHEDDSHARRQPGQEISCAAAAENRGAGATKHGADFRAFARLKQNDQNQTDADDDMKDGDGDDHIDLTILERCNDQQKRFGF